MKFGKRAAVLASAGVMILSISGAWAYFAQKRTVDLSVTPENMGIQVDTTAFKLTTEPMVPGDLNNLKLKVTNVGQRDVKVVAEVTIQSEEAFDNDSIDWFIASDTLKNTFGTGEVLYTLPETDETITLDNSADTVRFLSKDSSQNNDETDTVTFLVQGGELAGQKSADYAEKKSVDMSFWLALASKADNDFQGKQCTVTADIYAVQADHTDGIAWNKLKSSAESVEIGTVTVSRQA